MADASAMAGTPVRNHCTREGPDQIDRHEQAKAPERAIACRQRLASGLVEVASQLVAVLAPEAGRAERQRRAIQPSVERARGAAGIS